jgi:hypothetical protein
MAKDPDVPHSNDALDELVSQLLENDGLHWPRRDGLKWPHLASVVVGVDVA